MGKETAKILAQHFQNLDNLKNCKFDDLLSISEIGNVTAKSIYSFFKDEHNLTILDRLKFAKVNTNFIDSRSYKFEGLLFAITGKFARYSRTELTNIIEDLGGKVVSKVSKNVNYLLCGDSAGQKLENAKELNIKIILENDLDNFVYLK